MKIFNYWYVKKKYLAFLLSGEKWIFYKLHRKLYEFHNDIRYDEKYIYYAISFNKRIFGYIFLIKNKELKLEYIYIKKEYRNSGLGSKLLITFIWFKNKGL